MTSNNPQDDDFEPDVQLSFQIYPEGKGAILAVPIGTGPFPNIVIRAEEMENDGVPGVHFTLITGAPVEQTPEGLNEIADVLEWIVEELRGDEAQGAVKAWAEGKKDG